MRIDADDTEALCEAPTRHTEIQGAELFEKNYIKNGKVLATVFCVVGKHAEELTALVREWMTKEGFKKNEG
jgi:hypothetical protein